MCVGVCSCACVYTCVHVYIHVCMHVYACMCACVCVPMCSCACMHVYLCMHECMHVHVCETLGLISSVFLGCFPPYTLAQGLSLESQLATSAPSRPACFVDACLCFQSDEVTGSYWINLDFMKILGI